MTLSKQELIQFIQEVVAKELEEANAIGAGGVVGSAGSVLGVDTEPSKKIMWSGNEPLKESLARTLFHLTPWRLWRKIKVQGLIPQQGVRGLYADDSDAARIYLFESLGTLEDAMMNWFMEKFENDRYFAVIQVIVPGDVEIFDDPEIAGSFYVEAPIPVSNIKLLQKVDGGAPE